MEFHSLESRIYENHSEVCISHGKATFFEATKVMESECQYRESRVKLLKTSLLKRTRGAMP